MQNPAGVAAALAVTMTVTGCAAHAVNRTPAARVPVSGAALSPSASARTGPRALSQRPVAFSWHTARVDAAALGRSWRPGCPVGAGRLRAVTVRFWGFDRRAHLGSLVVNVTAVRAVVAAFRGIYRDRFPIRRMRPVAAYGGSDNASMAADNTSAFNCRYAVSSGPRSWSEHAYGDAVDIDPLENPYRLNGRILPPAGAPYLDRSNVRAGMVVPGSGPVRAFDAIGWGWGGRWGSTPDYQHFSSTGR